MERGVGEGGGKKSSFVRSKEVKKLNTKNTKKKLNSSPDARIALRRCFETAAFLCETFVFAYLGLQVPSIFTRTVDWGLLLTVVPLCVASRAAAVLPLARAANARRALPLPSGVVSALAACGLRGAVAYGLAVNLPAIKGESRRARRWRGRRRGAGGGGVGVGAAGEGGGDDDGDDNGGCDNCERRVASDFQRRAVWHRRAGAVRATGGTLNEPRL